MRSTLFNKSTIATPLLIVFLGLSYSLASRVQIAHSSEYTKEDLTRIFNHLLKNEFKSKRIKHIVLSKTVTLYSHDRGLKDSAILDLSTLNLEDSRLQFSNQNIDSSYSLKIQKINFFIKKNKYELVTQFRAGIAGGYRANYVYKKRNGVFKRWVYKRYISGFIGLNF